MFSAVGRSRDLSTGGAYVTTGEAGPFAPDDVLTVWFSIPLESRRAFPFSRIMGACRIVRVEPQATDEAGSRVGLALEFHDDRITLLGAI